MDETGAKLYTIECAFGEEEYTIPESEMNIRLRARHPVWMKENLINIAISRLPDNWKYVLWLDADIEFLDQDWQIKILEAFEKYDIIQVFEYADFLGPDDNVLETNYSMLYSHVHQIPIDRNHYKTFYPHPGYGWGITREAYEKIGGLIDFGVVGSGDGHMAFSLLGRYEESLPFEENLFHPNYIEKIKEWQSKVDELIPKSKLGYASVNIKHYFHGYREDRKYVDRMRIIADLQFDPEEDIAYNSKGIIQLKSRKDILEAINEYFSNRNEDRGADKEIQSEKIPLRTPEEVRIAGENLKEELKAKKSTRRKKVDGEEPSRRSTRKKTDDGEPPKKRRSSRKKNRR